MVLNITTKIDIIWKFVLRDEVIKMPVFKKCFNARPLYWILASIISACLGVICHISGWEFLVAQQQMRSYAEPYDSGLYDMLTSGYELFTITALVLGVIAIVKIVVQITKNWKAKIIPGIVEFLIFIFVGFFLFCFTLVTNEFYRMRRAISQNMLFQIRDIGNSINQYLKKYNHMPDAFWWCDSLINEPDIGVSKHDFHIGQFPDIECDFAYNKNLDKLPRGDIAGNVVLLFEADGDLNLSGGPELISKERTKDKYFLFKRQIFIYVLFVDGTIVKYRLHDGAISKYDPEKNEFTPYLKKGQTPYSPLRWKP